MDAIHESCRSVKSSNEKAYCPKIPNSKKPQLQTTFNLQFAPKEKREPVKEDYLILHQ